MPTFVEDGRDNEHSRFLTRYTGAYAMAFYVYLGTKADISSQSVATNGADTIF